MYKLFKFQLIPLDPPIVFGHTHSYHTRKPHVFFAQPVHCQLPFTQRYIWSKVTLWRNALSEEMVTAGNFSDNLFWCLLHP